MTFAIVGYGTVGQATRAAAEWHGHECVCVLDKRSLMPATIPQEDGMDDDQHDLWDKGLIPTCDARLTEADIAFVCVDTPPLPDGSCDTSNVEAAVADLIERGYMGTIAIRSTVPPGTIAAIAQKHCPNDMRRFIANPEFLRMRDAESTSRWPDFVVVGGCDAYGLLSENSDPHLRNVRRFYEPYFEGRMGAPIFMVNWETAALCKYGSNALIALAIMGGEQLYEAAQEHGADWNAVHSILQHCRVTPKTTRVDPEDRGFGGDCLPKDLDALRAIMPDSLCGRSLFDHAACANWRLRDGAKEPEQTDP